MTKEPPKGLRANLRSTYSKMDDDKLKRTCKPADFRKMLFGECLPPDTSTLLQEEHMARWVWVNRAANRVATSEASGIQ